MAPGSAAACAMTGACVQAAKDTLAATTVVANEVRSTESHDGGWDWDWLPPALSRASPRLALKQERADGTGILFLATRGPVVLTQAEDWHTKKAPRARA